MSDGHYTEAGIIILHLREGLQKKHYQGQFARVKWLEDAFYFERTSLPVWLGFLQGAPLQVGRFGHFSVQPRQGSNSVDCVGEAVIGRRFRFKIFTAQMIAE